MVKEKQQLREVCLDHKKPCAITYPYGDPLEQVTVPDISMSLSQMVASNVVMGGSSKYIDPNFDDDEEAHDKPDYEKLQGLDLVDKENFVAQWELDPNNYEKKEEDAGTETDAKEKDQPEAGAKKDEKAPGGAGA